MLPNLRHTRHGYTYLKTVPHDLRQVIGKTVIKKALGRDFKQARVEWAELEAKTTRQFLEARQQLTQGLSVEEALEAYLKKDPDSRLKALPAGRAGLAGQLSALYLAGLSAEYSARKSGERWRDESEPEAFSQDLDAVRNSIKKAVVSGDVSIFVETVEQLAQWRGYRLIDKTGDELQALTYEFLRAAQEGCQVLFDRQCGKFAEPDLPEAAQPLPAAWELDIQPKRSQQQVQPKLSDVAPLYIERLSVAHEKTQSTSLRWWRLFTDFCHDKSLAKVTATDVYDFFESRLHAEESPWSMGYCSTVARGLSEAFGLAKTKGLCSHNPVNDLDAMPKISAAEEKKRKKPRFRYSVAQLNIIFGSDWYDPAARNWRGRMKWDLAARYWVPLLCLYHGLRVREPLQLHVQDIEFGSCPLLHIQVEEDDEEDDDAKNAAVPTRRLKNPATKRAVPLHPVLLQLGFMDFVSVVAQWGSNPPLFLSALPKPGGKKPMWGRAYEQCFGRYVREVLCFGNGYCNHSFRHTLEFFLRDTQLDELWPAGVSQFYSGRTLPSDTDKKFFREQGSERLYGQGFDPRRILPYVKKIQYDGIKLPQPFMQWLDGRPAVDSHLVSLLDKGWGDEWRQLQFTG